MSGRTSVNKRQRELLRKERQAEKHSRRDERRVKRGVGDVAELLVLAPLVIEGASQPLDSVDDQSPKVK